MKYVWSKCRVVLTSMFAFLWFDHVNTFWFNTSKLPAWLTWAGQRSPWFTQRCDTKMGRGLYPHLGVALKSGSSDWLPVGGGRGQSPVAPSWATSIAHSCGSCGRCLGSPCTSGMSGWPCRAGTPAAPWAGSAWRPSNGTWRTNRTTEASGPWRTPGSWCAGVRVWDCWTQMTPSRMFWRTTTSSSSVIGTYIFWYLVYNPYVLINWIY